MNTKFLRYEIQQVKMNNIVVENKYEVVLWDK